MSADERRLTNRVLGKWAAISQVQPFPRRLQLAPDSFSADWTNCFVVELERCRLAFVGEALRNTHWSATERQRLTDYDEGSLVRLATAKIPSVLAKRGPITFGGTGVREEKGILYRAILLPLSDDGEKIDHVLGAINYRDISAEQNSSIDEPAPQVTPETTKHVSSYLTFAAVRRAPPATTQPRQPMRVTFR